MTTYYYGKKSKKKNNGRILVIILVAALFFAAGFLAGRLTRSKGDTETEEMEGSSEQYSVNAEAETPQRESATAETEIPDILLEKREYAESEKVLQNPYIGLGAWANEKPERLKQEISVVYVDVTWRELEPERGVFDFDELEKKCQFEYWIKEGKHAVFRFILDKPGNEEHMDIPDWLYEMTGDGEFYDIDYGYGYCPDYRNKTLIEEHERVIRELGKRYGNSDFIEFIELGSVGHWGEWHIHEDAGQMPSMEVCNRYFEPYTEAFPEAHLMLRRPFAFAKDAEPGLYNDSIGLRNGMQEWLDWIQSGGEYQDTREQKALAAMPDAWRKAAIGGEISSKLTDQEGLKQLLTDDLSGLLEFFQSAHTSWIAPGGFALLDTDNKPEVQKGLEEVLSTIGYRIYVSEAAKYRSETTGEEYFQLILENSGAAPFYKEWTIQIRRTNKNGEVSIADVEEDIRQLTADAPLSFKVPAGDGLEKLEVRICDPEGEQSIQLANDLSEADGWVTVWSN